MDHVEIIIEELKKVDNQKLLENLSKLIKEYIAYYSNPAQKNGGG